jgi:hypothetical protein
MRSGVVARPASHVYVYYRVATDSPAARATIAALLAEVESRTGVAGCLLARCDDPRTWMEVYGPGADAPAFARHLATLARRHRAADVAHDGKRHVERFAALPPLADPAPT